MTGKHAREVEPVAKPQITARAMPNMSEVRARHENACMAGEHAHHAGEGIPVQVQRSWQDVSDLHNSLRVLAADLLAFAQDMGMPDTYWRSDSRIARALAVLELTPEQAQQIDWMED